VLCFDVFVFVIFTLLLCYVAWSIVVPLRSADLHHFKTSIFIRSCKSTPLLFLRLGAFFCVLFVLFRNLRNLVKCAARRFPLCSSVVLCLLLLSYTLCCVTWCVFGCVVLFGTVAFGCVALCCVSLWWAVWCCVIVTEPCTRNVYAHWKLSMLSVDGFG